MIICAGGYPCFTLTLYPFVWVLAESITNDQDLLVIRVLMVTNSVNKKLAVSYT